MSKANVFTLNDVSDKLYNLRNQGAKRGAYVGLPSLYEKYSMKLGYTTYLYASPHMGKSQLSFQLAVDTARFNGWRWAIFSPESGTPADIYAELMWVYMQKPFLVNDKMMATDEEVELASEFISNHFFVVDSGLSDITATGILTAAQEIEYEFGKIQGLLVDPYTEVSNETEQGVREDIAIGKDLSKFRKYSSDKNWHTLVTVHTKYMQSRFKDGIAYIPKPTFSDMAGGQMWSRRGFMIINIWRCPYGLTDENGVAYEPNQVEITIQKAKPKITGSLGVVTLYYDKLRNSYYEIDVNGNRVYSIQDPNIDYDSEDVFIDRNGKLKEIQRISRPKQQQELDF